MKKRIRTWRNYEKRGDVRRSIERGVGLSELREGFAYS